MLAPAEGLIVEVAPQGKAAPAAAGPVHKGAIKMFNARKGFGFITAAWEKPPEPGMKGDVFVHKKQIAGHETIDLSIIQPGDQVQFQMGKTDDGRHCAVNVECIDDESEEEDEPPAKRAKTGEEDDEAEDDDGGESDDSSVEVDLEEELLTGIASEKGPSKDRPNEQTNNMFVTMFKRNTKTHEIRLIKLPA